ncbi:CG-1 domain-containing protein [Plasmodiophora brassicae]
MRLTVRTVRVWSSRYNGGDGAAPAPLMSSSSSSVPVQPTMKFPPLAMSTQEIIKATAQRRWLKNAELVDLLDNYDAYGFQCSNEPPQTPPISGTVLLFNKNQVRRWRQDGHEWKKKRDSKNIKEHHEKLKVLGVDVVNCCYAHHETIDGFHRRAYWKLSRPHIVLVHYLQQYKDADGLVISPGAMISPFIGGMDEHFNVASNGYSKLVSHSSSRTPRTTPYNALYSADDLSSIDTTTNGMVHAMGPRKTAKADMARVCRDKKKVYVDTLRQSIESLRNQIANVELDAEKDPNNPSVESKLLTTIEAHLSTPASLGTTREEEDGCLRSLVDQWVQFTERRKREAANAIAMVPQMLNPGDQAKFALWGFDHDQSCLWSSLLQEKCHTNPGQIETLKAYRGESVRLRNELLELVKESEAIREAIESFTQQSSDLVVRMRHLFTDEQLASGLAMFRGSQQQPGAQLANQPQVRPGLIIP